MNSKTPRLATFILVFIWFPLDLSAVKVIPEGESIQKYINSYLEENLFELESGLYSGNIVIDRPLKLRGKKGSVIRSTGTGTTVRITADKVVLKSVTIEGSGGRYDQKDAGIAVNGDRVLIEDILIVGATFGIVVELAQEVSLIGNTVQGNSEIPFGLRGDGIRIWESEHSLIISNDLIDSRDIVVWYASSNTFRHNRIMEGRYGIHFMYSHYNQMSQNRFLSNVVGAFIMYSRHLTVDYNLFAGSTGPSGYGVGIKESGNLIFSSNIFVNNTTAIYSDNAPYDSREENLFQHNLIASSETGIEFHGQPKRNVFRGNTLRKNRVQVRVSGKASAEEITWKRNYYDDYRGYDLDQDGIGDLPYEYRKLMNQLSEKYPALMFFDGTAVYYLINLLGDALPLMKSRLIMRDSVPMVAPAPLPFTR